MKELVSQWAFLIDNDDDYILINLTLLIQGAAEMPST